MRDNGRRFDLDDVKKKKSLGLVGMRERARMFNADLVINHNAPSGTLIRLTVPLEKYIVET